MSSVLNKISIIIPCVNEGAYINNTIDGIRAVEKKRNYEIIVVDDCSTDPVVAEGVKIIRNNTWLGRPESIKRAIAIAKYENIMILNARMVFIMPFIDRYLQELKTNQMVCATCVWLTKSNPNVTPDSDRKYGASVKLMDKTDKLSVFKIEWNTEYPDNGHARVMLGATTATTKSWWGKIKGLEMLHAWGSADAYLSLKTWMAGGTCKVIKDVEIGNIFRNTQHYAYDPAATCYNKMVLIYTLLPMKYRAESMKALEKTQGYELALNWYVNTLGQLEKLKKYYQSITVKSVINFVKH